MNTAAGVLLLTCLLTACASPGGPSDVAGTSQSATAPVVRQVKDYNLYTHCGIREARIGSDYYKATPPLDDGMGNPPAGWGNPYQRGTMTVYADGTARFSDSSGHVATFTKRPKALMFMKICA